MDKIREILLKSIEGPPITRDWITMFHMHLTAAYIPSDQWPDDTALAQLLKEMICNGQVTVVIENHTLMPTSPSSRRKNK